MHNDPFHIPVSSNGHTAFPAQADHFSVRQILEKYLRRKWLFLAFLFICLALAVTYLWIKTPLYNIYAALVIKDEKKGETTKTSLKELDFFDEQKIVDNESEIIRSKSIVEKVVQKLQLNIGYYRQESYFKYLPLYHSTPVQVFIPGTISQPTTAFKILINKDADRFRLLTGNDRSISFGDTIVIEGTKMVLQPTAFINDFRNQLIRITVSTPEYAIQQLRESLVITQASKNSSMLNLTMPHASPERGSEILNAIIREYNYANITDKKRQTDITLEFIEERLRMIAQELGDYESKEETFKSRKKITELGADAQLFLDKVKENDAKLSEARIQLEFLTTIENYVSQDKSFLAPPSTAIADQVLTGMVNRLGQLQIEKEQLSKTVGPENPVLKVKISQVENVRAAIIENIRTQKKGLQDAIAQLSAVKSAIDYQIRAVPSNERNLANIIREKNIRENIYTYLLQKREEAGITQAAAFSSMRVVDSAYSSAKPVKPNKLIVLLIALLAGLALPVFFINLRELLNTRVNNRDIIARHTTIPVAGELSRHKGKDSMVLPAEKPGLVAEQLRMLRMRLQQLLQHRQPQTILVTSAVSGEGKSFVSLNLASALALSGNKVLLIALDLRHPRTWYVLQQEAGAGMSDYLNDTTIEPHRIISLSVTPGIDIITAGNTERMDFDLLTADRLQALFAAVKNNYQYIIIDTPPCRLVSDAMQVAGLADATLYVVRHRKTHIRNVQYAEQLHKTGVFTNMLLVYNSVPATQLYAKETISYIRTQQVKHRKAMAPDN